MPLFAAFEIRTLDYRDYSVLGVYFLVRCRDWIWWCATRNRSSDDFLRAGGRTSWWAAGISFFATASSSISFMAIPAKTYSSDWMAFGSVPAQVIATLSLAIAFV